MTTTNGDQKLEGAGGGAMATVGPRQRDFVAALPEPVQVEINCMLRDGWRQDAIVEWLFGQTADRDVPEHRLKKGERYGLIWLRKARDERVARVNCRTVIGRWWRGPYQDWLARQPKPFVRPPTPKAVKIGFRALAEELKGNRRAMNLLARLNRAVRRAMQRQREEVNAMPWRP